MRETRENLDDQKLRAMEIRNGRNVDVRARVMERIAEGQGSRRRRRNASGSVRRHAAVIVIVAAVVLLTSITGYAANRYLQLKNSRGEVVLKTKEREYNPYATKLSAKLGKERESVEKLLKPGEQAVYYVKGGNSGSNRWNLLQFVYVPYEHDDYDDFLAQTRKTNGPALPRPGYMPEGYVFEAASVQAQYGPLPPSPEYEALAEELLAEAAAADDRTLFYKVLPWSEASGANLRYRKGEAVLNLFAYKTNGNSTLPLTPDMHAEKTVVGGTEAIIYESGEGEARKYYRHRVMWYGTEEGTLYVIADDPGHPLEKRELIRIAESMIAQKRP